VDLRSDAYCAGLIEWAPVAPRLINGDRPRRRHQAAGRVWRIVVMIRQRRPVARASRPFKFADARRDEAELLRSW